MQEIVNVYKDDNGETFFINCGYDYSKGIGEYSVEKCTACSDGYTTDYAGAAKSSFEQDRNLSLSMVMYEDKVKVVSGNEKAFFDDAVNELLSGYEIQKA